MTSKALLTAAACAMGAAVAFAQSEPPRVPEQRSSMRERFGIVARVLIRLAFAHVRIRPELVERVRQLASQGTIIYVMRYRSAIDYLLVNAVLLREGLPLARFAPGVSTVWWRPLGEMLPVTKATSGKPVTATGRYGEQLLVPDRKLDDRQGFYVLTLLRTGSGKALPVVRGWLPGTADAVAGSPEALRAAVTWVAGMTDRFAFTTALAQLGWRPEDLPQGIDAGR